MKLGMCNELLRHRGIEGGFTHLARLGYDGVEVAPWTINPSVMDISDEDARRVRGMAEVPRIEILGLHWVFGNQSECHLTHPSAQVRKRTLEYLHRIVTLCGTLGGRVVIFGSPNQRRVLEGVEYGQAWDHAKEVLGSEAFLESLEKHGVTFCLEPLSANQTNFITTTEEAVRFVKEIDHPQFGMMLDGYTLGWAGEDVPKAIRLASPFLKHFHADDETGKGPGYGKLDYMGIATALRAIQFTGYVSVEIHNYDLNPEECASRCIQYLRRIFG